MYFPIKTPSFRTSGDQFVFIAPYGKEGQWGLEWICGPSRAAVWAASSEPFLKITDLSHPAKPHFLSGSFLSALSCSAVFSRLNSCTRFLTRCSSVSELSVWSPWVVFEEPLRNLSSLWFLVGFSEAMTWLGNAKSRPFQLVLWFFWSPSVQFQSTLTLFSVTLMILRVWVNLVGPVECPHPAFPSSVALPQAAVLVPQLCLCPPKCGHFSWMTLGAERKEISFSPAVGCFSC